MCLDKTARVHGNSLEESRIQADRAADQALRERASSPGRLVEYERLRGGSWGGQLSAAESSVEYGDPNLGNRRDGREGKASGATGRVSQGLIKSLPRRLETTNFIISRLTASHSTTRKRAVRRNEKVKQSEYDFIRSLGGVEPLIHWGVLSAHWMALVSFITSVDVKDRNF